MTRRISCRVILRDGNEMMGLDTGMDGQIVIAEAVKRALERFDARDANKNGVLEPSERGMGMRRMLMQRNGA
jgi:hypothetical protein